MADLSATTDFSTRLRTAMEAAGISNRALGKRLKDSGARGSARDTIVDYLKADGRTPSIEWVAAAAELLGVRAEWLAFASGPMKKGEWRSPATLSEDLATVVRSEVLESLSDEAGDVHVDGDRLLRRVINDAIEIAQRGLAAHRSAAPYAAKARKLHRALLENGRNTENSNSAAELFEFFGSQMSAALREPVVLLNLKNRVGSTSATKRRQRK